MNASATAIPESKTEDEQLVGLSLIASGAPREEWENIGREFQVMGAHLVMIGYEGLWGKVKEQEGIRDLHLRVRGLGDVELFRPQVVDALYDERNWSQHERIYLRGMKSAIEEGIDIGHITQDTMRLFLDVKRELVTNEQFRACTAELYQTIDRTFGGYYSMFGVR